MKKALSLLMCFVIICVSFSGCSGKTVEITEENIVATVNEVNKALKDFDTKKLKKYVDSPTLSSIISYAEKKPQFRELGKAIFEHLSMEIVETDIEKATVTVKVKNKNLTRAADSFATKLKENYSGFQLLTKLADDEFLDEELGELKGKINRSFMNIKAKTITLTVTSGKKNLVLGFDEEAENAVSGGAVKAIKGIMSTGTDSDVAALFSGNYDRDEEQD